MIRISRWRLFIVAAICLLGLLFTVPNFMAPSARKNLPTVLQEKRLRLGLDLQGGSFMVLEVDTKGAIQDRLDSYSDMIRKALRKAGIITDKMTTFNEDNTHYVEAKLKDATQIDAAISAAREELKGLMFSANEGTLKAQLTEQEITELKNNVMQKSITIIENRVDGTGTSEPEINPMDNDRIAIQLPGVDDPDRVKSLINKTAKLSFHMVKSFYPGDIDPATKRPSFGHVLVPSLEKVNIGDKEIPQAYYEIKKRAELSGDSLQTAKSGHNEEHGAIISFEFTNAAKRKFAEITAEENRGKSFAIVLDDQVIMAPRINDQIKEGSGIIHGGFDHQQAEDLAVLMRSGALPATLTVLEEKTVGPSLGSDSISAGQKATVFSIILVGIFMFVVYSLFGLFANIALAMNLVLLIAGLSLLEATLTLPGIAGIALTIGMAVDANVLIFERIREELDNGRKPMAAIEQGFNRAFGTIVDSNLTTIIGALLLFWFGTGVIRGFAVTLTLGIIISMFTAVSLTRLIVVLWANKKRPTKGLPV